MAHGSTVGESPRCGEWVGTLVTFPSFVTGEGEPYQPTVVMWLETESGIIVGSELVRPEEALPRAVGLFQLATREPIAGEPRVPRSLRVSDAALAAALSGGIGDVELVVAPTPEIDLAVEAMLDHFARRAQDDDEEVTHFGPDITEEDLAWFFRAAARLYRAQPWSVIPGDTFVSVSCEQVGITDGALTIVGQHGEAFGFSLFRSVDDAATFIDAAERRAHGDRDAAIPQHVMLSFDARDALHEDLVGEIAAHRWEIAGPAAHPSAVMINSDLMTRGLTRDELLGVTAIIETLAEVVETESGLAEVWSNDDTVEWSLNVATPVGEVAVVLRAPLWLDTDEPDEVDDLLQQFAESPEAKSNPDLVNVADMLLENAVTYHSATLTSITPAELDQLLFKTIPHRVSIEPGDAALVVDALRALLAFAARAFDSESARACLDSLTGDVTQRLARELADESNYSVAKGLVMSGIREGYDLSTEEGVAAWIEVVNQRGLPRKGAARKASGKSKAKRAATPKRKPPRTAKAKPSAKRATPAKAKAKPKAKKGASRSRP